MCYSTALRKQKEDLERQLKLTINSSIIIPDDYEPYFHLNGFSHVNLYLITMEVPDKVETAKWGLIPDWASHDSEQFWKNTNTLNARSETIFEKSSFKESAKNKRCLILADGFFEPHHLNNVPIPYFCYQPTKQDPDGGLFLFAGLYNDLLNGEHTATIITTEANPFFAKIHNKKQRMPLVLNPHYYLDWLDNGLNQQSVNELMAVGFSDQPFKAHAVSRDLYNRHVDSNQSYIIEPTQKNTLF